MFGLYGIVKFYIEKLKNPVAQVMLKVVFFAAVTTVAFTALKSLLFGGSSLPDFPIWVLIGAGIIMLLLYDLIYTLLIRIYCDRFRKEKKIHFELSKKGEEENEKNE